MNVEMNRVNWGSPSPQSAGHSQFRCGNLLAELHVRDGEIGLSSRTLEPEEQVAPSRGRIDFSRQWTQWAVCTGGSAIELSPRLPGLPVLAEVDETFLVGAGETLRVYLRIPVTVVVRVNDTLDEILAELPAEDLEECWFGEVEHGELCHRLPGALHREGPRAIDEGNIQAPVTIRNEASETLEVSQLCLRVAPLSIYEYRDVLWASETLVRFQGGRERSRVSVRSGPPAEAPLARLVTPPQEKGVIPVVGRTFRSLRQWTHDLLEQQG